MKKKPTSHSSAKSKAVRDTDRENRLTESYRLGATMAGDVTDALVKAYGNRPYQKTKTDRRVRRGWELAWRKLERALATIETKPKQVQEALSAIDSQYGTSLYLVEDQAFMAGLAVGQAMGMKGRT